ncbi:MAG TPA: hypothetical protein VM734_25375 [Kofleriaceae bacterium]|nr:hypothetical protein [Kofleriaceae bacterium]
MRSPVLLFAAAGAVLLTAGSASANQPCRYDRWSAAWSPYETVVPAGCPIEVAVIADEVDGSYETRVDGQLVTHTATELQRFTVDVDRITCAPGESCGVDVYLHPQVAVLRFELASATVEGQSIQVGGGAGATAFPITVTVGPAGACPAPEPWSFELCGDPNCNVGLCDAGPDRDAGFLCDGGPYGFDAGLAATDGDHGGGCSAGGASGASALVAVAGAVAAIAARRRRATRTGA